MAILVSPPRADPAIRGPVARGEAVQAGDDMGAEQDVAEAGGSGVGEDAAEALEEPGADLAEHDVIEACVAAGANRPVLVEGGRAVFDPPAPGRLGLAGCQPVSEVGVPVLAQGIQDRLGAQQPDIQLYAVGFYPAGEASGSPFNIGSGDEVPV